MFIIVYQDTVKSIVCLPYSQIILHMNNIKLYRSRTAKFKHVQREKPHNVQFGVRAYEHYSCSEIAEFKKIASIAIRSVEIRATPLAFNRTNQYSDTGG